MSDSKQIKQLLRQGVTAAKAGDKEKARKLFEKVIEQDKNNEKAWLYMARVVESEEQQRVCLGNVLYLNPDNEKARRLLSRLETGKKGGKRGGGDVNKRLLIGGGIGAAALLLVLLLVVVATTGGGGDGKAPTPTVAGEAATEVSATDTPTPLPLETIPPTWTTEPSPTVFVTPTAEIFPTPQGIPGKLVYGSGPRFFSNRFLAIQYSATDGSNPFVLGDEDNRTRGRNPAFSPDGQYVVYELGATDGSSRLTLMDMLGENRRFITQDLDEHFGSEEQPAWSPDTTTLRIAFAGSPPASYTHQIHVLTLQGEEPPLIVRVTDNHFDNTWPTWSTDGSQLVYVTDRRAQGGVDLRVVDLPALRAVLQATQQAAESESEAPTTEAPTPASTPEAVAGETPTEPPVEDAPYDKPLTSDGNELIERAPDWYGNRMVFEGTSAENYDREYYDNYDSDIYIIDDVAGRSMPRLLFPSPEDDASETARDMQPRFSPDGRYITFTSNRTGDWEIYILEIDTNMLYQVTNTERHPDIVGDWGG